MILSVLKFVKELYGVHKTGKLVGMEGLKFFAHGHGWSCAMGKDSI